MSYKINDTIVIRDGGLKNISSLDSVTSNTFEAEFADLSSGKVASMYDSAGNRSNLEDGIILYDRTNNKLKIYDSSGGGIFTIGSGAEVVPKNLPYQIVDPNNLTLTFTDSLRTALDMDNGFSEISAFDNGEIAFNATGFYYDFARDAMQPFQNSWTYDSDGVRVGRFISTAIMYPVSSGSDEYRAWTHWKVNADGSVEANRTLLYGPVGSAGISGSVDFASPYNFRRQVDNWYDEAYSPWRIKNTACFGWDSDTDKRVVFVSRPAAASVYYADAHNKDSVDWTGSDILIAPGINTSNGYIACRRLANGTKRIATKAAHVGLYVANIDNFGDNTASSNYGPAGGSIETSPGILANGPIVWISDTKLLVMNYSDNTASKGKVFNYTGSGAGFTQSHEVTFSRSFQYCVHAYFDQDNDVLTLCDRQYFYQVSGSGLTTLLNGSGTVTVSYRRYGPSFSYGMYGGLVVNKYGITATHEALQSGELFVAHRTPEDDGTYSGFDGQGTAIDLNETTAFHYLIGLCNSKLVYLKNHILSPSEYKVMVLK